MRGGFGSAVGLLLVAACGAGPGPSAPPPVPSTPAEVRTPLGSRGPVSIRFEGQSAGLGWLAAGEWVEIGAVFVPHDGRPVVDARWAGGALEIGADVRALGGEEGSRRIASSPGVRILSVSPWTPVGRLYGDRAVVSLDVGSSTIGGEPATLRLHDVLALRAAMTLDPVTLGRFPRLEAFSFLGSREAVSAAALAALGTMTGLRVLELRSVVTDSLEGLSSLRGLERLALRMQDVEAPLGAEVDELLRRNEGLVVYVAPYSRVGVTTAALLGAATALEAVDLSHATLAPGAWDTIVRNPALRAVTAQGLALIEADLAALVANPHLRAVDLRWAPIPRAALARLASAHALEWAGVGSEADDALVAELVALPSLASLAVSCAALSDAAITSIAPTRPLRELSVGCAPLSDASLDHLAGLPALTHVEITGAQLTEAGIARFRERRPEVVLDTME